MRMRILILLLVLLTAAVFVSIQSVTAQGCRDPFTGAPCTPTPAAADRDNDGVPDDVDACPDGPGTRETGGCPQGSAPGATAVPSTSQTNPLRPAVDGPCQLVTFATVNVNVREAPSINGAVVATLDPAVLYDVQAAVISEGKIWYRVEAGWVSQDAVVVGGDCPVREIEVRTAVFNLDAEKWAQVVGGVFPETECVELPDESRVCFTELAAVVVEGTTEGLGGGDVVVCGGIPPANFCAITEFVSYDPEQPEEFFEDPEPSGGGGGNGGDGGGEGDNSGGNQPQGEGDGQVYCEDVMLDLAAASESNPVFFETSDTTFGVLLGDGIWPPDECMHRAYDIDEEAATDETIPVNLVSFVIPPRPTAAFDYLLKIEGIQGESTASNPTQVNAGTLRIGTAPCFTFTHGDFSRCPGQQPEEEDDAFSPGLILDLDLVFVPDEGATEHKCYESDGDKFCKCQGRTDCRGMRVANVCKGPNACDPSSGICVCVGK